MHSAAVAQQAPPIGAVLQAKIDADVRTLLAATHAPGATVAIVEHGTLVYAHGYGLRDLATSLPADEHTRYEIGSITKQFTAAAIVQLTEAGKIDLDAKVATYLPSVPHAADVTVRNLLTQTSGLYDYVEIPNFDVLAASSTTFDRLMSHVSGKPLSFAPGTFYQYSNTNYLILGRIVEVVSGETWEAYVQRRLFAPAGMTESATMAQESQLADMARGYVYAQGHAVPSKPIAESWASSAGGIVSTVGDLQKWGDALRSGHIISPSGYQLLTSPARLADGTATEYGFGLKLDRYDGQPRIWHHGNTSGYDGSDQFFPSQETRIIVLTNGLDADTDRIVERLYDDLFPEIAAADLRASQAAKRSPTVVLYSHALRVMDGLRQPKFLSYRMESTGDGVHIDVWADSRGQVWLRGNTGSSNDAWALRHRTADYLSEIVHVSDGRRYVTARSFFDPTWYGAVRALRLGMFGSQDPAAARDMTDHDESTGEQPLKAIGSVSVMGPAAYDIQDRGDARCPNGQPGHALHFVSRQFDPMHQLSDVVIDTGSGRFCVVTFFARYAGGVFVGGTFEQHYADVNGYWMQTDGVLDGTWQSSILSRKRHGVWRYRLVDVTVPDKLSDGPFARAEPPPK